MKQKRNQSTMVNLLGFGTMILTIVLFLIFGYIGW